MANRDLYGKERGACNNCRDCDQFVSPNNDGGVRCVECGCTPVDHTLIRGEQEQLNLDESCSRGGPSGYCYSSTSIRNTPPASVCNVQGCLQEVDFDINTGFEYQFCNIHLSEDQYIIKDDVEFMYADDEEDPLWGISSYTQIQEFCPPTPPLSVHNTPQATITGAPISTCALPECNNPRHVDASGKVFECCGITHAMEYQRRLHLQQAHQSSIVKGITHCLLPNCNKPVWPFCNYCGRTHADAGNKMGLTPPQTPSSSSTQEKPPNICIMPDCSSPKYVGDDNKVHAYCGKSCAQRGRTLGIFPMADNDEDQCELEGCSRPKRTEGDRVHDYCCKDHADKDTPNRAAKILTKTEDVKKWLANFSNLSIIRMEEIDSAKPPNGHLFKAFQAQVATFPRHLQKTCLAFHGTSATNIPSICQQGYDPGLRGRHGQAYGQGEYFATNPNVPMNYCCSERKMLLNQLLLGKQGTDHTQHGEIIVMKEPKNELPRYIITFK